MAFCSIALVLTGCNGNNAVGNTQIGEETGENTMNSSGGYTGSSVPYSMCLDGKDGEWRALHDADNTGFDQNWQLGEAKNWAGAAVAQVPGNFYMITDGTGEKKVGIWWFRRTFEPEVADGADMRYFLQFGAVDYYCEIYLNGTLLGTHEGQEVGFAVEATEALKLNEKNVLVVKVYEPGFGEAIIPDMAIESIPTGQSFGGIQRSVYLIASGELALEDLYCIPEYETGKITSRITVNNPSSEPRRLSVTVTVTENGSGGCIYQNVSEAEAEPGSGVISIDAQLKDYKLWDINAPTLYNVTVTLDYTSASGEDMRSQKTERIGFRDFRVKDGWFFLNGRRIFLKCAHTSNTSTVYRSNQDEDAQVLEDIYKMKAAGFNCIRFLHTPANQEQLDLCDELGIMVYQEHPASWPWRSGTVVEERFLRSLEQRLLSDRNHPGIVIWGLLNENSTPSTFILARDSLSMLKDLDDTRVFLLNSGRFDQIFETGSVSNPGSEDWEAVWGYEGEKQVASRWGYEDFPEYYRGCGDIHIYPREQASAKLREVFSFFGVGTKPVFI